MIFSLFLAAALLADDTNRQENYEAMLSCAAFHTIEATRTDADGAEAQQAVAVDFAKSAVAFAPDRTVETVNADLAELLVTFREELDSGDVRQMAEDWTALEGACQELYPMRDILANAAAEEPVAAD